MSGVAAVARPLAGAAGPSAMTGPVVPRNASSAEPALPVLALPADKGGRTCRRGGHREVLRICVVVSNLADLVEALSASRSPQAQSFTMVGACLPMMVPRWGLVVC